MGLANEPVAKLFGNAASQLVRESCPAPPPSQSAACRCSRRRRPRTSWSIRPGRTPRCAADRRRRACRSPAFTGLRCISLGRIGSGRICLRRVSLRRVSVESRRRRVRRRRIGRLRRIWGCCSVLRWGDITSRGVGSRGVPGRRTWRHGVRPAGDHCGCRRRGPSVDDIVDPGRCRRWRIGDVGDRLPGTSRRRDRNTQQQEEKADDPHTRVPAQREQNVEARLTPGMVNNPSPPCGGLWKYGGAARFSGNSPLKRPEKIDPPRLRIAAREPVGGREYQQGHDQHQRKGERPAEFRSVGIFFEVEIPGQRIDRRDDHDRA